MGRVHTIKKKENLGAERRDQPSCPVFIVDEKTEVRWSIGTQITSAHQGPELRLSDSQPGAK